jgi:hypothetical protein
LEEVVGGDNFSGDRVLHKKTSLIWTRRQQDAKGRLIWTGVIHWKSLLIGGIAIDDGSTGATADDGTKHLKFIKTGP